MPYCKNCGKEIADDAYFCQYCGSRTEKASDSESKPSWIQEIDDTIANAVSTINTAIEDAKKEGRSVSWGRDRFQIEDEKVFTGKVDTEKIYLYMKGRNGYLNVSSWDKPEYHVKLYIRMRGYTKEEAELNLKDLSVSLTDETVNGEKQLILDVGHPALRVSYSVDIDVKIPRESNVRLELKTSNGRINLKDVHGSKMEIKSSNGKLLLENIEADILDCKTSNGRITVSSLKARNVFLETSNGRIEGDVSSSETDIHTSNGKVRLDINTQGNGNHNIKTSNGTVDLILPETTEIGYDIELRTSQGRIYANLSDLEYTVNRKHHLKAHTKDFENKESTVKVKVNTSNSKILINS